MFCVHCGKKNEDGVELCAYCGKPLNDHTQMLEVLETPLDAGKPEALKPEQPYCVHCGKPNDATAELCAYCGKPLNDHTQMLEVLEKPIEHEAGTHESPKAFCVHCGKANDPSESLCAFCGKPLNDHTQMLEVLEVPLDGVGKDGGETPAISGGAPSFCWHCGQRLLEGSSFCSLCGAPVEGPAQQPTGGTGDIGIPPVDSPAAGASVGNSSKAVKILVIAIIVVVVALLAVIAAYFFMFHSTPIDEEHFPDTELRQTVSAHFDSDGDGKLSGKEAQAVTTLDLSGTGVSNLQGLGTFKNLSSLNVSGCASLDSIDCSVVPTLTNLNISNSGIRSLDPAPLKNLQKLDATGTGISQVDVSQNSNLSDLKVDSSIVVSGAESTGVKEYWLMTSCTEYIPPVSRSIAGLSSTITVEYDQSNCLTKRHIEIIPEGPQMSRIEDATFVYDEKRRPVSSEVVSAYDNPSDGLYTYSYGEEGISSASHSKEGDENAAFIQYEYDSRDTGHSLLSGYTGGNFNRSSARHLGYDENGRLSTVNHLFTDRTSSYSYSYSYSYDESNHLLSMKEEGGSAVPDNYTFTYDAEGHCLTATYNWPTSQEEGVFSFADTYSYDENGRLIAATRDAPNISNGSLYEYGGGIRNASFTYDDYGNLIEWDIAETGEKKTFTYMRVYASEDEAPVGYCVDTGNPLAYQSLVYTAIWDPAAPRFFEDQDPAVRFFMNNSWVLSYQEDSFWGLS